MLLSVLDNFRLQLASLHRFHGVSEGRLQPNKGMYEHEHAKETHRLKEGNSKAQLTELRTLQGAKSIHLAATDSIFVGCKTICSSGQVVARHDRGGIVRGHRDQRGIQGGRGQKHRCQ